MTREQPIKVFIIDDSAVVRQVLSAVLGQDPGIAVIGTAQDPIYAMQKMNREWPDVVVLDVEMPRMDGITFLRKLMSVRPTPVIVCSTLTERGAETTIEAMAAGAVTCVTKPTVGLRDFLEGDGGELIGAVHAAAAGNMRRLKAISSSLVSAPANARSAASPGMTASAVDRARAGGPAVTVPRSAAGAMAVTTDRLVAIGTSTGGTQALQLVLSALPRVGPGIVVVQHMPEKFTAAFAQRLDGLCESEVKEAENGDRVLPGRVLIAPGGRHMTVKRYGAQYKVELNDRPPVNRHRPSVDVLFESVARSAGANALGVIMTGMGDDGARGMKMMRDAGARTIAQDEATCVVYGMPHEAAKLGGVDIEVPLHSIPGVIERYAAQG